MFWISSWFPTTPHKWAIFAVVICAIGVSAAFILRQLQSGCHWPAMVFSTLSVIALIGGAVVAFMTMVKGTSTDGAIVLFFALGLAGYLHMISRMLSPKHASHWVLGAGWLALLFLASWSWLSAVGMYVHRGAPTDTGDACILVSKPDEYDTELSSIWKMRLPDIASHKSSRSGSYIFEYHAILVLPDENTSKVYNWSKVRLRFEVIDRKRSPYLPSICP
jgi:hypothetical protein